MNAVLVRYRDHTLILVAVPFINALNYYLTYSNIRFGSYFFITFFLDILEGYVAWYAGRWVILQFDKSLPWENHLSKRLALQIPLVSVVIIAVLVIQTELVNFIATDKPLPLKFYTQAIFIFLIWAIFINFLYLALYFLRRYQQVKQEQKQKAEATALLVKSGKSQKRVPFDAIAILYVANDLVYGVTNEGKIPMPGYTLDRIEKMVDPQTFFRANRQFLVTRSVIDQAKKEENGKLALFVKAEVENPIMISRLRAPAFKKWMDG